jgi:hypothetical protein
MRSLEGIIFSLILFWIYTSLLLLMDSCALI